MNRAATVIAAAALPPSLSAPLFALVVAAGEVPVPVPAGETLDEPVELVVVELEAVAFAAAY